MIATRILAFAVVSAASLATMSAAQAVLRGPGTLERATRLSLIPSSTFERPAPRRTVDCVTFRSAGAAPFGGFVRGPGSLDRSADARGGFGEVGRTDAPQSGSFLRIIPRSTVF